MSKKPQIQKFREAAREIEVDLTEGRFNRTLKRVALAKSLPEAKAPSRRKKR